MAFLSASQRTIGGLRYQAAQNRAAARRPAADIDMESSFRTVCKNFARFLRSRKISDLRCAEIRGKCPLSPHSGPLKGVPNV
jgi:hypothetical protein